MYAFLVMSYCVTRTYLKGFTTWFPLSRIDFQEYESTQIESIRQNFSPPCAFIRKSTSGESEVFEPQADSNRLCFKTIRLSLGVLDMSGVKATYFWWFDSVDVTSVAKAGGDTIETW